MIFNKKHLFVYIITVLAVFVFCGVFSVLSAQEKVFQCEKWSEKYDWNQNWIDKCLHGEEQAKKECNVRRLSDEWRQGCVEYRKRIWFWEKKPPNYFWTCANGTWHSQAARDKCERVEKEFWSWAGRPYDSEVLERKPGGFFMPRYAVVCSERALMIKEWNAILHNGGHYYPDSLEQGCWSLESSAVGRIAEVDGNLVRIQYRRYEVVHVIEAWTHSNLISTTEQYQRMRSE